MILLVSEQQNSSVVELEKNQTKNYKYIYLSLSIVLMVKGKTRDISISLILHGTEGGYMHVCVHDGARTAKIVRKVASSRIYKWLSNIAQDLQNI